jgi:hypothetical protein
MKTTILTAQMREVLMRAYLQIQVDEDQEVLTLDYAARISAMPDTELVERLTAYSREGRGPYRIAQEALLQWRASRHSRPQEPEQTGELDVQVLLTVSYELGGADNHKSLAEGIEKDLDNLISSGDLLTNSNASTVTKYSISSY